MTPTICSDKKQLRETRRHHGVATVTTSSAAATTASSSSSSSSSASTSAAAATQVSSVLAYVAKGSMNPSSRRRPMRLQRRLPHFSARQAASSSTDTSSGVETEVEMDSSVHRMHLDEDSYSAARIQYHQQQQQQQHSSSDSNIKTVLQPNSFSSKHNRSAAAAVKLCEEVPTEEEDDDGGDSGYGYSQEPVKGLHLQQHYHHHNSDGLLSIAIKTIKLVQRNKLLQKRLTQLQLETSEFIASVLANPENRQFREKIAPKAEAKVSNVLLRH
ncbi:pneumococcal serine-rich repeat protein [Drosophila kikkawai]|uniref:Pneumococcal serine-rich repeat protein n=1 Tax=Drosophila kikkawai TaxID=30033 RepID=A0A6P4J1X1_DROKI|nr:cell wall integrity and stress response component 1 [Drosophila kikkawai]XP_041630882.1 cell wall integrity and stress response component 1 [Drosophila kikkawai]